MQNGPRFLTETDINTIQLYTALTGGSSTGGWTPGFNSDPTELGYPGVTGNGRRYRFCLIGGTSTVKPGTLLTAPAQASNSTGLAIPTQQPANTAYGNAENDSASALSAGSLAFNVTNSSTAVTQDEFAGGYVDVLQTSGSNNGPTSYQLSGNTAAGNGGTITLYLKDPLAVASALVAGTDTVNLRKNTYANVVASSTLAQPVGIVPVQVPNSSTAQYYAWVQTGGQCDGLCDSAGITAFDAVQQSTTTAGDVTAMTAYTTYEIGQAISTGTSGNPITVVLNLP